MSVDLAPCLALRRGVLCNLVVALEDVSFRITLVVCQVLLIMFRLSHPGIPASLPYETSEILIP